MKMTATAKRMAMEIEAAEVELDNHRAVLSDLMTELTEARRAEWSRAGGCEVCRGWGETLSWWTLDGSGWDERKPCTNPACTAKTVGTDPTSTEPSSRQNNRSLAQECPSRMAKTAEEQRNYAALAGMVEAARAKIEAIRAMYEVRVGSEVVVCRGKKIAIGTRGCVFWIGSDRWGKGRIGMTGADGQTHWTAASNVEVAFEDTSPLTQSQSILCRLTSQSAA